MSSATSTIIRCESAIASRLGLRLLIAMIALVGAAKSILYDTIDPDSFWHLRVGEQLLSQGIHPLRDTISFSSIQTPWTPYSWLCEILMVKIWHFGGFRLAILCTALCVFGFIVMLAMAALEMHRLRIDTGPRDALAPPQLQFVTALTVAMCSFISMPYFSFRPVTLALFILACCYWLLMRDRRKMERSRAVWMIIPMTALLINIHLFAVLIPIWFTMLTVGAAVEKTLHLDFGGLREMRRSLKRYALLTAATIAACCLTPMLPGLIEAIGNYAMRDPMVASQVIGEMRPFYSGGMGKVSLVFVAVGVACAIRHQRRLAIGDLLLFGCGLVLLFWKGRMSPLFAISACPVLSMCMPQLRDQVLGRRIVQAGIGIVIMLGIVRVISEFPDSTTHFATWLNRNGPDCPGYPTEAAEFIASGVEKKSGRLINEFNWGGYLGWALQSDYKVFLDGRTQVFAPQFWQQVYLKDGDERRAMLTAAHADAAIVPVTKSRFKSTLISLGWKSVHQDDRAEVLIPPERFVRIDLQD